MNRKQDAAPYFVIDAMPQAETRFRESGVLDWENLMSSDVRGKETSTSVTANESLRYAPVFAGIALIAGDISSMPWETKRLDDTNTWVPADDHPTYSLLKSRFAPDAPSANVSIEALVTRALFYGLGCARIYRESRRRHPKRLELITSYVRPVKRTFRGETYKFYEYTDDDGREQQVAPDDMLAIPGPTLDAFNGLGLYEYGRRVVGRALAASKYTDEFFTGGAVPQGWFVHPEELSMEAKTRFLAEMQRRHDSRRPWGLLEEDMKWISSAINPNDAMLVALLEFSAKDVARFLKLPPDKLGITEGGSPAKSVEQSQKNYLLSCLHYWLKRCEAEANDKLFRDDEKGTYRTKFDTAEFIAATTTINEQREADRTDVMMGARTLNEVRRDRGLVPYEDEVGSRPMLPLNMTTNPANLHAAINGEPDAPQPEQVPAKLSDEDRALLHKVGEAHVTLSDEDRALLSSLSEVRLAAASMPPAVLAAQQAIVADTLERMATRLGNAMAKAARRPERFLSAIDALESDHRSVITEVVRPALSLVAAYREVQTDQLVSDTVDNLLSRARTAFLDAADVQPAQLQGAVKSASSDLRVTATAIAQDFFRHLPGEHDQKTHGPTKAEGGDRKKKIEAAGKASWFLTLATAQDHYQSTPDTLAKIKERAAELAAAIEGMTDEELREAKAHAENLLAMDFADALGKPGWSEGFSGDIQNSILSVAFPDDGTYSTFMENTGWPRLKDNIELRGPNLDFDEALKLFNQDELLALRAFAVAGNDTESAIKIDARWDVLEAEQELAANDVLQGIRRDMKREAVRNTTLTNQNEFADRIEQGMGATLDAVAGQAKELHGLTAGDINAVGFDQHFSLPAKERSRIKERNMQAVATRARGLLETNATADTKAEAIQQFMEYADAIPAGPGADPVEKAVAHLTNMWATSSSDSNKWSLATQMAVAEKFNAPLDSMDYMPDDVYDEAYGTRNRYHHVFDTVVDAIYEHTQESLKSQGVKELIGFRGMGIETPDNVDAKHSPVQRLFRGRSLLGDNVPEVQRVEGNYTLVHDQQINLNPLSSFATAVPVTETFAQPDEGGGVTTTMAAAIPVERVFSTAFSGFGCVNENEMVVIGGPLDAKMVSRSAVGTQVYRGAPVRTAKEFMDLLRSATWNDKVMQKLADK